MSIHNANQNKHVTHNQYLIVVNEFNYGFSTNCDNSQTMNHWLRIIGLYEIVANMKLFFIK